ncbi:hypothetical protein [Massilia sp. METH4]|uniref:hypothetical protein n=1 Tax=Massilia sp. METH4 TaxID=3123041 RepID=UPI0030CA6EF5
MKLQRDGKKAKVLKYTPELLHDGEKGSKEKFPDGPEKPVTGTGLLEIFLEQR